MCVEPFRLAFRYLHTRVVLSRLVVRLHYRGQRHPHTILKGLFGRLPTLFPFLPETWLLFRLVVFYPQLGAFQYAAFQKLSTVRPPYSVFLLPTIGGLVSVGGTIKHHERLYHLQLHL